jgi:hypothetical protein
MLLPCGRGRIVLWGDLGRGPVLCRGLKDARQFRWWCGELEFELGRDETSPLVNELGTMRA